ncbi:hypothetical protein HO133_003218 [Letharia lupina]|uniref:Uncharacterized protein n=1 Tax=Letharia lupina TaxID=560253 RepID=A0A8H6F9B9_9LECA|nr:uncharacterized protein HO133_003218 [Letharia lupina]KAF6220087.1 hypothetical protein HO133_003218 [Letharia lupina]
MAEDNEELNIRQPEQTDQNEEATPDPSAPPEKKGSMFSAPGNFGNSAGDKIQGTLGKVGGPVGKGLETVAAPVGGLIDPLVGGLFRAPETLKNATQESEKVDQHNEELEKPIAGQEQTGGNPLGLNS